MAFNNKKIGELRPNQIITTYGPGSVVDAIKDSLTILDISYWKDKGKKIIDGRLASYLGVDCFYMPSSGGGGGIPVVSFPYWHVCQDCGRLFDIRDNFNPDKYRKQGAICPVCEKPAYPSRFITICENGHMSDFPWKWWVHKGNINCNGFMKLTTNGKTSTLADLWVKCSCGAARSMSGATQRENFNGFPCEGHHPFRPSAKDQKSCNKNIIPSQRGASNVYFAVTKSAISIPPWISLLDKLIDDNLHDIELARQLNGDAGVEKLYELRFSQYKKNDFLNALERRKNNIKEYTEIKQMEYKTITDFDSLILDETSQKHFKAEEDPLPSYLTKYFSRIIRVTRLREVRVLLGFTRVDAPDPEEETDKQPNIVKLCKSQDERWLPATEINGEGIFIEFNKETLKKWINNSNIKEISQKYAESYLNFCNSKGWTVTVPRDAIYVLIHTFSHLIIKQMSMSSGYSTSAIRERIYFGENMAGILLYTGSSDKEGSLGGLVELGMIKNLTNLIREAFREALVCTNDPECMSKLPAGTNSNGAACHSCCMISETACENGNRMLDRGLVVPIPGRENCSYFRELVGELCQVEI